MELQTSFSFLFFFFVQVCYEMPEWNEIITFTETLNLCWNVFRKLQRT